MHPTRSRAAAAVLGVMLLVYLVLPMAAASAATAEDVLNADEAWFLQNKEPLANSPTGSDPTCDLPTGCNLAGNATRQNPHDEGVLVVAANAGDPDAQTFFTFDLLGLPPGAQVTGGKVTMPVAQDPDSGNLNEGSAKLRACLTTGFVPAGTDAGSWEARPAFDNKVCEAVEVEEESPLTFSVSLDRFGKAWSDGATNNGITVMVDPDRVTSPNPAETWRVSFNTARRAEQETKAQEEEETPEEARIPYVPITSTIEYKVEELPCFFNCPGADAGGGFDDSGDSGFESAPPPDTGSSGGFTTGDTGGDFGTSGAPATSSVPAAPPADSGSVPVEQPVTTGPAPAEQPVAAPATTPVAAPGVSPAVWATPLAAIAGAAAIAWSLMQPVELAGQREGAVSRLMRRRRLSADPSS